MCHTNKRIGFGIAGKFTGIINKSDANTADDLKMDNHFTYISLGIGGIYSFNNHVGIGIDILFSREGQAFSGNFHSTLPDSNAYSSVVATQLILNDKPTEGTYVALAELNYIKVPLMLSLTTDNTQPVFFTALVGPQINFLYGVAQEVNEVDLDYPHTNIEPKDLYKPLTFGGVLALGAGFNITPHLILSARFRMDYGFNDAEKKDVMVTYFGTEAERFYSTGRQSSNTITRGLMIGVDFKL